MTVPPTGQLPPPPLPPNEGLEGRDVAARAYARAHLRLGVASAGLDLAFLAILLATGASLWLARALALSLRAPGAWEEVLAFSLVLGCALKALNFPLQLAGRRLEIRYQLNRQRWRGWWWDQAKAALVGGVFAVAGIEGIYWLLRRWPDRWWLWAWAGFALFVALLAQLAPVLLLPLFFKFRPFSAADPREAALADRLRRLCEKAATRVRGVFEWQLGAKTSKANAALVGWGPTRRILVSDTLLAQAPPEEIEAVLAHELGHHVHRHIWKGLIWELGLSLCGFWVADRVLHVFAGDLRLRGIADIAGLPLLMLVASVLALALVPVNNAFSRRMERQADDYAFAALDDAAPLMASLRRLGQTNLAEIDPPRWRELIFYSHPAIATRLRRGEAWLARHHVPH